MKKLLLTLAFLVPTIGFGQKSQMFGFDWREIKKNLPGSDWKKIMPQQGGKLLDIVTKADEIQIPDTALEKLDGFFEIRTQSQPINTLLGGLRSGFLTLKTSKDPLTLIEVLQALHKNLALLPLDIKAAKANQNVQKAFELLEKVFIKIILNKAEKLYSAAQKLTGTQKTELLKQAFALIYAITDVNDKEILDIKTNALNLQSKILDILPQKNTEEILQDTLEKVSDDIDSPRYGPGIIGK